jgi:hypothetical protein
MTRKLLLHLGDEFGLIAWIELHNLCTSSAITAKLDAASASSITPGAKQMPNAIICDLGQPEATG